jgi:glycosyltransferase involved in cell wall biosynthesis
LKKTVVLTSHENFVWLSMQEIIPLIERNWRGSRARGRHEVVCRDVDQYSISELMPELLSADNIVFTCFTVRLCRLGELLRKSFGVEARYIIYLHNQATILCWPFHVWGMGGQLREDDVFISTSTADAGTFRHSFERARALVIPFTVPGLKKAYLVAPSGRAEVPFVYAGRLSVQKNLHTLIYALRLMSDEHPRLRWRLQIYGKDDDLGSPNMGMPSSRYEESLRMQVRLLGLGDRVEFMGYQRRAQLHRNLFSRRHVAVSASLHSDENFGMAQFRSLCRGNPAVLTRWGGYADFGSQFGNRVRLAPVDETPRGPWVDPQQFARLLGAAARDYLAGGPTRVRVPSYYREDEISSRLRKLALEARAPGPPLELTRLAERILRRQAAFEKRRPGSGQIFESYADDAARVPFRGYLMSPPAFKKRLRAGQASRLFCPPWVALKSRFVRVDDPHRGRLKIRLHKPASQAVTLSDWFGKSRSVSATTAARLVSLGYAHCRE